MAPTSHYYTFTIVTMVFWWKLVTSVHFSDMEWACLGLRAGHWSGWWTNSYLLIGRVMLILVQPERKSGGHRLWRTQHFPLLPPFLQLSSFSSFPSNFGHQSVQKNINNNISCFWNLRLCFQTWTNIFNKSFKLIPYFVHSQSSVFLTFTFLTFFPYQLNSHL